MTINPVLALFYLYLIANFIAMQQGLANGGMVLEGRFFQLEPSSLIYSFLLQFLVLFLFFLAYRAFNSKFQYKKMALGANWGWFLILVQVAFLVFNLIMGINIAGDGARIEGGSLINYIFILLQPDILFLLVGISLLSNRLFLINVLIFLISMALRGWMGGFFIIIFMLLTRYYPVRISLRNAFILLCVVLSFLFILPAIIEAKWAMRSGVTLAEYFSSVSDSFSIEKYSLASAYLLNRFQHVGHVALLLENADSVATAFHNGAFVGYWMDGLPQYTVAKAFGLETFKLNSYMVKYFFGITDPTWNTNPGIAGWLFVLKEQFVFMILYLFFIMVIPFYFIGRCAGNALLMLVACFSITYLFHGWVGAYFNIVFYALSLIIICKTKIYSKRSPLSSANKVAC